MDYADRGPVVVSRIVDPVGAEYRVIPCDLGVLVDDAAKPVSLQHAPSGARRHAGTSEEYGRYIGGPAARIISPLPRYRILCRHWCEITDRVHRHTRRLSTSLTTVTLLPPQQHVAV